MIYIVYISYILYNIYTVYVYLHRTCIHSTVYISYILYNITCIHSRTCIHSTSYVLHMMYYVYMSCIYYIHICTPAGPSLRKTDSKPKQISSKGVVK